MPKLTLADITDLRAYEHERDEYRRRIIALKQARRVHVGPFITLTFENAETMRFQVQEMARAERMLTDAQIQAELEVYNPLIPEVGHLSATLFVELTTEEQLRYWLPRLVGIERAVLLKIGPAGQEQEIVRATTEAEHQAALTREEVTASVHYLGFALEAGQADGFASGPAALAVDHPDYREETLLSDSTRAALTEDLRHGG